MNILITESQFKRLIENIIDESNNDIKTQEFIDILNQENIPYEIKNNKIIIGGDNNINSELITYIPDNVEFNNGDDVDLDYLKEMGNNIKFNNKGYVNIDSLDRVGNNILFNNKGYVALDSIIWFSINSVNFTNNVKDVYFGKELFWGNEFPYQIYNIKGNFKMWDDKKGDYKIIK